jgi:hypothetical protein
MRLHDCIIHVRILTSRLVITLSIKYIHKAARGLATSKRCYIKNLRFEQLGEHEIPKL